ncbi:MAG: DUF3306 domain-containing protein [Betaproteobacteria bacterium]|nr:DUF3306 domain-containing protein [Betaproteobacteria bacterium]
MAANDSNEAFLARWTRLKKEAREQPAEKPQPKPEAVDPKAPAPELPPLDKLTFDSDYRAFFHPKVDEDMRRAALKKLFSDPRFNVMDGLDVYIDDYSKSEPIPAAMMAQLRQAQQILEWAKETKEETDAKRAEVSAENVALSLDDQAPAIAAEQPPVDQLQEAEQRPGPQATTDRKS